ncbi:MAG: hypothetical protein HY291_03330 [Planctomycetes bacterium]|nr:hypothetical protein [Planctomycetota bacterium]
MEANLASMGERWARRVRMALVACIALLAVLIFASARDGRGTLNPFDVRPANAELISAAPGYLALSASIGNEVNFYLLDSTKQVICVYQMVGDKIRLVAARDWSRDTDIPDSSLNVVSADGRQQLKAFEGGTGLDRKDADAYADAVKKLEAGEKK